MMIFAGVKLFGIYSEYKEGKDTYNDLADQYAGEDDPLIPITVSFEELLKESPNVIGWIYCEDTPINYPVVQADDNEYYLNRMANGNYNGNGSIFVDYRNKPDFSDWNTVVYGHNMDNDTMFGILTEYQNQEFYDSHKIMYLLTPEKNYEVRLISGYVTPADSDIYVIPSNIEERNQLLERAYYASNFDSDFEMEDEEKLITLSTCAYNYKNARYVLIGILHELPSSDNAQNAESPE